LDILAANAAVSGARIIPVVDAKRNLVYTSVYKNSGGKLTRLSPYMLLSMEDFFRKIKGRGNSVILGDAVNLYRQDISKHMKGVFFLDKDYWYPRGRKIIDLALEAVNKKKISNALDVRPVYLYPKECQVKKLAAHSS
jgi:tRNA threonylcarbamoyladenosine biosynthesis protein TsaB